MQCGVVDICKQSYYLILFPAHRYGVSYRHTDIIGMHTVDCDLVFVLRKSSI